MPRPKSPPRAPPGPPGPRIRTAYRIEALRRFANVVRKKEAEFAELIARETGKPLWEARTEVGAVVNKVEISVEAYAERTPQRKMEAALGNQHRGPPQAAWRARRARARIISRRTCPTGTSSRR